MINKTNIRYFIERNNDLFLCTSTLDRNADGNFEFHWESDFQSGYFTYRELDGNIVEISKAEFDLIKMTIENDELTNYQYGIKAMVIHQRG